MADSKETRSADFSVQGRIKGPTQGGTAIFILRSDKYAFCTRSRVLRYLELTWGPFGVLLSSPSSRALVHLAEDLRFSASVHRGCLRITAS